ncbi:class I SAM-dependent methyltransferase [Biformimicrobium ophioploci]|uniref:Class I SAM-dependent methyltransferase n=1 Tax=Biformimicrobium ophioploci TaxID=3036711 RepID=A0ABQ6M311_9GAMM|nr:class I SAM-dependent methyltransferase [Microbulbifer sp. NKW57]GMG88746.1 class I SAM-dependent methyltransferase [Microbulbifer sp. NKW57]
MDYLKINRDSWDKRTAVHVDSRFYDVEGFLRGKLSLTDIELKELGGVSGKSLLHLQCHFGLDTLSWARLGADVTGVDLSPAAIDQAKALADQAGLKAHFICSDLYGFGESLQAQFDVVFTSYGALCWLPDIQRWADIVAGSLKEGGTFYIAEFHPFYDVLSGYSYFHRDEPDIEEESTYTENDTGDTSPLVTWAHPLSDVVNALIRAGIRIEQLNEYPYSPYNCFDGLEERQEGRFYLSHNGQDVPLVYTIKGIKGA